MEMVLRKQGIHNSNRVFFFSLSPSDMGPTPATGVPYQRKLCYLVQSCSHCKSQLLYLRRPKICESKVDKSIGLL